MADSFKTKRAVAGDIIGFLRYREPKSGDLLRNPTSSNHYYAIYAWTLNKVSEKRDETKIIPIEQLVQEGAIQLYKTYHTGEYILGAAGQSHPKYSNTAC